MIYKSKNVDQTLMLAAKLAHFIDYGSVILLNGDLGAGKTTFVKGFAREIGIQDKITSPTFTILKNYQIIENHQLIHVDAYRLEHSSFEELEDYISNENIIFIEWSEHLNNQELIKEHLSINIRYISKNQREITLTAVGDKYEKMLQGMSENV